MKYHLWHAANQMYGKRAKKGEYKSYRKDSRGNKVRRAPEESALKCLDLMLFSHKAEIMIVNPL